MITTTEALATVLSFPLHLPATSVNVAEAVGKVLRENLVADRDFPPFDRVSMDGIALVFQAWEQGQNTFLVEEVQLAGQPQKQLLEPTGCLEVMTGAVLPTGTDTVVRYEDVELFEQESNRYARVLAGPKAARQNVHGQGTNRQVGEVLVPGGTQLSPAEIAVAASVGKETVQVTRLPRVALVSTGDELVAVARRPQAHQIRMSNVYMLQAALRGAGAQGELFHLPDQPETLARELQRLLRLFDGIILSGGVSKGKADYVPQVLAELGVRRQFHQVAQRPGKPLWFGVSPEGKAVFALPGNPVSTFVCYYQYVQPWLQASLGLKLVPAAYAVLAQEVIFEPNLTYFLPVRLELTSTGRTYAHPVHTGGSGDFASLLAADGFLVLPQVQNTYAAGEAYPLLRFR